jgi:hypothetical protein
MTAKANRGVLYVTSGLTYLNEAIVSARSIKSVWPDVAIAIIADRPVEAEVFDIVQIETMEGSNIDRVRYIGQSPFERTVQLDSDTYCLEAFPELFDLLDRFDLAAAHDTGRYSQRLDPLTGEYVFIRAEGIPDCFPEFNSGVVAFRRTPQVLKAFEHWLNDCRESTHPQDQPSFRKVIYNSDLRVATLPSEYCFRLVSPDYARTAVKIIHGRWTYSDLGQSREAVFARLGSVFNRTIGPRVLVHAFGIISGHGPNCIPLDDRYAQRTLAFDNRFNAFCFRTLAAVAPFRRLRSIWRKHSAMRSSRP